MLLPTVVIRSCPNGFSASVKFIAFFALFWSVAFSVAAADGKAIFSANCIACHGSKGEGNAQLGAPNIGGMEASYLARQLANFSSGIRGSAANDNYGAQMRAVVAVLKTDADRTAVANYVAGMPRAVSKNVIKADLANGSTQFNAVCSSCHGSHAQGNQQMGAPSLLGTDPQYVERQILAFRTGLRGVKPEDKTGALMRVGANMLPDVKSAHDVAAYITTIKP